MSTVSYLPGAESEASAYDVVFVGAGISSTFTVIELLERLEQQGAKFARLLLIDRDADFFKGVPYGTRSGDLGLIISRVADFLPAAHVQRFAEWLADNREQAFGRFFALGGELVETWRSKFWSEVESGSIADLYLPRYVFGLFFEHLARRAIERAHENGVASCETAVGEVVDIDRVDDGFSVITRQLDGREVRYPAARVVLGVGSAPSTSILASAVASDRETVVIDDPFQPGIADMLERIRSAVPRLPGAQGRILIVGSNAGALDVIFNLMNDRMIASAIHQVEVLSTSGKFPETFSTLPSGLRAAFYSRALTDLATRDTILADDIFEAVRDDIERARREGLTISDTFWDISVAFNALVDRLSPDEKLRFANDTGPRIGTMQRRVGQDYWGVVKGLIEEGRLIVTQGRFPRDDETQDDLLAIINCTGSGRLNNPELPSNLVRNLLERGSVRLTDSQLGIAVNDDLETDTAGLYVIGPMLTGNLVHGSPTWNLEHCGRIAQFSRHLATHLVDRAFVGSLT